MDFDDAPIREAEPSAAAGKTGLWSTAMPDSSDDQKGQVAAQAANAAFNRQEQEKAEAVKLRAKQESLLQKQREENKKTVPGRNFFEFFNPDGSAAFPSASD